MLTINLYQLSHFFRFQILSDAFSLPGEMKSEPIPTKVVPKSFQIRSFLLPLETNQIRTWIDFEYTLLSNYLISIVWVALMLRDENPSITL